MLNPLTQVLDIIQLQNFAKFIFFPNICARMNSETKEQLDFLLGLKLNLGM